MRRRMDKFLPLPGASLAAKVSILVNVSILVASRAEGNGKAGTQEEAKAKPANHRIFREREEEKTRNNTDFLLAQGPGS